jgi:hypothetical protein
VAAAVKLSLSQRSPELFHFFNCCFLINFLANMTAIPVDGTWFDTLNKSFADVPIGEDEGISTTEFLEAADSLVTLFGVCYSTT